MRSPRFLLCRSKCGLAPFVICVLAAGLAHPVLAHDNNDLQKQMDAVKAQVAALQQQQQLILGTINQIKQMLASQAGAAPPAQPAQPTMPASINVAGMPVEGDSGAKVAIVEFTDFQCPVCGKFAAQIYPQLLADYIDTGKIRYIYEDFPLTSMHPHAAPAANAAHCAAEQGKFWQMHDSLYANQDALGQADFTNRAQTLGLNVDQFNACVASGKYDGTVQQSVAYGSSLGVNATPTMFIGTLRADGMFVPDHMIRGLYPYEQYKTALDAEFAPKA
jgi:protein-disulfide isomerase